MPVRLLACLLFAALPSLGMSQTAAGSFDVDLKPQAPAEGDASNVGRMTINKTFHGDLSATSVGQMLAFMTMTPGSAGYVAMERVTGTLAGRTGAFTLQHTGSMNRGEPSLSVTVVPDSGTEGLTGLTGTMQIDARAEGHRYTFDYALPASE